MHIVAFRRPEKLEIWCLPFRNNSATTFVNVSSRHFTQWTRQLSLLHKRALNREHLPQLGVLRSGYMTQLFYDGQFVQGHFVRGALCPGILCSFAPLTPNSLSCTLYILLKGLHNTDMLSKKTRPPNPLSVGSHIVCSQTLHSSATQLLVQPFTRTDFSRRAFRFSAPSVWNSLLQTVLTSDSRSVCF